MKKTVALLLTLLLVILSFPFNACAGEKLDFVEAKSVVLMCTDNNKVLYKENEYEHLSPASVTKIMTILLVLEALESGKIKLTDTVTASAEAVSMGGSQIWLEQGEKMSVEDLFKAVVVASANDACTALAEYIAGSTSAFVSMMNKRAAELGCENTNFENCNGLDDTVKNHYSCAYDLALISSEVMKHSIIEKYTLIWLDSLRNGETELNNTNKLINTYNGITGLKTGTTSNAGFCVAATAQRDNMNLVAVVLGSETSEQRFDTAANLLDWGFANYEVAEPKIDERRIKPVKIRFGKIKSIKPVCEDKTKILIKKGSGDLMLEYSVKDSVDAPVKKGQKLGEIVINDEKGRVGSIDIISPKTVNCINILDIFKHILINI